MNKLKMVGLSVVAVALVACGSSKPADTGPGPQPGPTVSPLWKLAPADAVGGIVVEDGSLATMQAWFVEFVRIADGHPVTKKEIGDEIRQEFSRGPVSPLDVESLTRAGVDLSKGAAVFVNAQEKVTMVLPISDRKSFAGLVGGQTSMESGVEVETFGNDMMCKMFETRYVCAQTADALAGIGAAPTNMLVEKASAMPETWRGDVQMLLDAGQYNLVSKMPEIGRMITDTGVIAASATMSRGKLSVRAHMPGTLIGDGKKMIGGPNALVGKIAAERPSGFARLRVDPSEIPAPSESIPGIKLADIVKSLTGEVIMFAHAGTSASASVQIGLSSADSLRQLVKMGCGMAGMAPIPIKVNVEGNACRGSVDLGSLPPELQHVFKVSKLDVDFNVADDRLDARMSLGTKGPVANAPSPSALGNELLAGDWNLAAWGEGFSPIYLSDLLSMTSIPARDRDEAQSVLWMIGHVYEAGFGLGFRSDGIHMIAEVTSFAAAPDADYKSYEDALSRAVAGDITGAKQQLDSIAKRTPAGIIARQVGLKSGAYLGGVGVGAGMFLALIGSRSEESFDSAPAAVPAP